MNLKIIVVLIFSIQLYACSKNVKKINLTESSELAEKLQEEDKKQPVSITVSQAFFVSNKLQVKVIIEAKTDLPADKIAIKIAALKEGEVIEEQVKLAKEVLEEPEIKANQRLIIPFELQSEDFNEYQIQCSWGEEAVALMQNATKKFSEKKQVSPLPEIKNIELLSLEQVELVEKNSRCKKQPCPISYSISSMLVNKTGFNASGIKLAVGIDWAKDGQLPKAINDFEAAKESEEILDLGDSLLPPFAEKKVKVDIDRELPKTSGGKYYPYIRIVEFSSKK